MVRGIAPLKTRAIEVSRIKYDKLDASILADLVRWFSYITSVLK